VQCGFCTPGMLLSASALLKRNPAPSAEEVREALSGNLCRCSGYVKPVQAVLRAAAIMRGETVAPISRPALDEDALSWHPDLLSLEQGKQISAQRSASANAATLVKTSPASGRRV